MTRSSPRSERLGFYRIDDSKKYSLSKLLGMRQEMDPSPVYQRQSGVWDKSKQRFLMDTILNGFIIPPIYLHEYLTPQQTREGLRRFAIIDGKQRLEAIWAFMDGDLRLAKDFKIYANPNLDLAKMTYKELALSHPEIRERFDSSELAVTTIQTGDLDIIDELFLRLNEASPLNAAEKRNSFPGRLVTKIRELSRHKYFREFVPFEDRRYRYMEQAAKFLYMEDRGQAADLKKEDLDRFTLSFAPAPKATRSEEEADRIHGNAEETLNTMAQFFEKEDPLLEKIGPNSTYFLLFLEMKLGKWNPSKFKRSHLTAFEEVRTLNRERASRNNKDVSIDLLKYDQLAQSNDEGSYRVRSNVIKEFVETYEPSAGAAAYLRAHRNE
jgi:hypothetical protein